MKNVKRGKDGRLQVEAADLMTDAILGFLFYAKDLGWDGKAPIQDWFGSLTKKERFEASGRLIDLMLE